MKNDEKNLIQIFHIPEKHLELRKYLDEDSVF